MRLGLAALVAFVMGCESSHKAPAVAAPAAPIARLASEILDREGDSTDTAVILPAEAPDGGVKFENDWIYDRVGRFRRWSHGTGTLDGRRYDVIEVETTSGERHKSYFDITENWNK